MWRRPTSWHRCWPSSPMRRPQWHHRSARSCPCCPTTRRDLWTAPPGPPALPPWSAATEVPSSSSSTRPQPPSAPGAGWRLPPHLWRRPSRLRLPLEPCCFRSSCSFLAFVPPLNRFPVVGARDPTTQSESLFSTHVGGAQVMRAEICAGISSYRPPDRNTLGVLETARRDGVPAWRSNALDTPQNRRSGRYSRVLVEGWQVPTRVCDGRVRRVGIVLGNSAGRWRSI